MSGRSFVSGFRFVKPNGKFNCLGYIHPGQEVRICFSDGRHASPYTISGWQLAVENQGFRAVAVLTPDGTMSCWTGEPENVPRWRLQGPGKRISAIKVEFDVSLTSIKGSTWLRLTTLPSPIGTQTRLFEQKRPRE
jgi:hypothetical protein